MRRPLLACPLPSLSMNDLLSEARDLLVALVSAGQSEREPLENAALELAQRIRDFINSQP